MTTNLYLWMIGCVSASVLFCAGAVAGLKYASQKSPDRPTRLPTTAVWRATPTDDVVLWAHGDWIACWDAGPEDHCLLTDVDGVPEYEGGFSPVLETGSVPNARLRPVASESFVPWMWSARLERMVPIIPLEDGTVLAPTASAPDLQGYVAKVKAFTPQAKPLPLHAQYYHPAGTPE